MSICRVCHRSLRNPISIAQGVGPKCMKKIRALMAQVLAEAQAGQQPRYENLYALSPGEIQTLVEQDVRNQYLEAIRNRSLQPPAPQTVTVRSATRNRSEEVEVQFVNRRMQAAVVRSPSGNVYNTTAQACSCHDFTFRHRGEGTACRHMQAFQMARDALTQQRQQNRTQEPTIERPQVDTRAIHEANRRTFAQIDWTIEADREQVLNTWRENKPFDGVYVSRDDAAWERLRGEAENEWEYQYENVLGGTGNTFGYEMEIKFSNNYKKRQALEHLAREGLTFSADVQRYHSGVRSPLAWVPESDSSLGSTGVELVSPILKDDRQTWERLEKICSIVKEYGGYVDQNCGGHIHIGIAPLDHRTYSWQRLARIGLAFERQFFRIGGADAEGYRSTAQPGKHRGTSYSAPLPRHVRIPGLMRPEIARQQLSPDRYKIFNATNIDNRLGAKPTLEMRYPNSTLDVRQIQAQIITANAIVHQAAVIRNESPQSSLIPGYSDSSNHLRRHDEGVTARLEEDNFRKFTDVLGSPLERKAATWLWLRGRV